MNKKPRDRPGLPAARRQHAAQSTYDHCLRSRHYVNVVVAGKQPQADWLTADEAAAALRARRRDLGVGGH